MPRQIDRHAGRRRPRARVAALRLSSATLRPALAVAALAVAVLATLLSVTIALCGPAPAAALAESFGPAGPRWLVYLVVGGTLVISGGGYLYLRFFAKDRSTDDEDDADESPDLGEDDAGESSALVEDDRAG